MGGVCTCICVCVCVLGRQAQMCILKKAALTSCAFCECSPRYTVRLRLSLEPRTHWQASLPRQLTSRDPISMVQVVRLDTSHRAHPELRQMLGIWAVVFMLASIHWFIFPSPKHILTCFILTYLVYVHAHTCMYATVNVWQSNYSLTKLVLSFHHGPVLPPCRTGYQTWKLSGSYLCSLSHLASPQIIALSHTYVSPLSFISSSLFLKWFS